MPSPSKGRKSSKQKGESVKAVSPAVEKTKRSRKPKVAQEGDFKLIEAEGKTIEEVVETVKVAKKRGAPKGSRNAAGNKGGGRKSSYQEKYVQIAEAMCKLGATDYELAEAFGVCETTIKNWAQNHIKF